MRHDNYILTHCPPDERLGVPLFTPYRAHFGIMDIRLDVEAGVHPDGTRFTNGVRVCEVQAGRLVWLDELTPGPDAV